MDDKPILYKEEMAEEVDRMKNAMPNSYFFCSHYPECEEREHEPEALRWVDGDFKCRNCYFRRRDGDILDLLKTWKAALTLQQVDGLFLQKKLHELGFRKL